MQLEAISPCPITCYLGKDTDIHLTPSSLQVVVESDKVSPQPPFLQTKQPRLPQLLLIRLVLQTLHQLRYPSLDRLQQLHVLLVVRGPEQNTVFKMRPQQSLSFSLKRLYLRCYVALVGIKFLHLSFAEVNVNLRIYQMLEVT